MKHFFLFFDGSTGDGGNPGTGGCGSVCYDKDSGDAEPIFRESRTLGKVTSNFAEYYGLITGLRRILHDYPITEYDVTIRGDSELIINQMKGEYEVRSRNLYPLYIIAKGLRKRIKGQIYFEHVARNQNKASDKLAKKAAKAPIQEGQFLVFYPSLMGLLEGSMNGRKLIVGNDVGGAARTPEVLFDATTILEILGEDALETLLDPGNTTRVNGKVDFTVLGIIRKPVTLTVVFTNGPIEITIDDIIVVDFLPYDAQISINHPRLENTGWSIGFGGGMKSIDFNVNSVPKRFQSHPYWHDNTAFLATGYGIRQFSSCDTEGLIDMGR